MLSQGRNSGEYIVLQDGDNRIIVQVAQIDGNLRLVVDAPREVSILRGEVYEKTHPVPGWIKDSVIRPAKAGK